MLEIKNIKKSFNGKIVLDGINLTVKEGEVYGLVGANGAGKTTLFNIITRIINQDSGEILVDGKKINMINDLAGVVGYIIDIPAFFDYMTAYEYFEFIASPLNMTKEALKARSDELLNLVGLADVGNKRLKQFSRGMRQRMGIAVGLIGNAKIIIMDEPSSALDPQGRFEVLQIIENLKAQGKTVVLSTHILSDVERVCDRVGLLINHKIAEEGTIYEILNSHQSNEIVIVCSSENALKIEEFAKSQKGYVGSEMKNNGIEISSTSEDRRELFNELLKCGIEFNSIAFKTSSIEEIFLSSKGGQN